MVKSLNNILSLKFIDILRHVGKFSQPSSHVFADASQRAFGAVAYLVENSVVSLVLAKSRLAPINAPSLPQLELTSLNVAARFVTESYRAELSFAQTYLWTASEIVLCWTKQQSNKKPYVTQRLNNIRTLCPNAQINHVPSKQNPRRSSDPRSLCEGV